MDATTARWFELEPKIDILLRSKYAHWDFATIEDIRSQVMLSILDGCNNLDPALLISDACNNLGLFQHVSLKDWVCVCGKQHLRKTKVCSDCGEILTKDSTRVTYTTVSHDIAFHDVADTASSPEQTCINSERLVAIANMVEATEARHVINSVIAEDITIETAGERIGLDKVQVHRVLRKAGDKYIDTLTDNDCDAYGINNKRRA